MVRCLLRSTITVVDQPMTVPTSAQRTAEAPDHAHEEDQGTSQNLEADEREVAASGHEAEDRTSRCTEPERHANGRDAVQAVRPEPHPFAGAFDGQARLCGLRQDHLPS